MEQPQGKVEKNTQELAVIKQLIQEIEGLDDFSEFLELIQDIQERLNNLNVTDIKQSPLPGQGGFSIPEGVAPGTQQETNYYLADLIATTSATNNEEHEEFREQIAQLESDIIDNSGDLTHKLDKRGDTMSGDLLFSGRDNITVLNDESMRLKSSRDDNPDSTSTHVTVGRNGDGDPITNIYHLQRPQQPNWAVNMEYSDEKDQELQDQIDTGVEIQQQVLVEVDICRTKSMLWKVVLLTLSGHMKKTTVHHVKVSSVCVIVALLLLCGLMPIAFLSAQPMLTVRPTRLKR